MKQINIEARVKRNNFTKLAGESYCDKNSPIVQDLNKFNKKALLGIQRRDGVYTIIGEEFVYYLTSLGVKGEILHKDFLDILKRNAFSAGKSGNFEHLDINESDSIWILNGPTMNAMWNTILLLSDNR